MGEGGNLKLLFFALIIIQGMIAACATTTPTATDLFSTATPRETTEAAALSWERELNEGCRTMIIGDRGQASFGPCSNPSSTTGQLQPGRLADLSRFLDRYRPFEADTPAGRLGFAGRGIQVATRYERQALAEWATLVHQELQFGRSGASWGLAVALIEEGSTPCSRIQIEVYGKVLANDCRAGIQPLSTAWLTAEQLDDLYEWTNEYQTFEINWNEGGLPLRLVFSGRGAQVASESEQREILAWVNGVYQSVARGSAPSVFAVAPECCPGSSVVDVLAGQLYEMGLRQVAEALLGGF